MESDEYGLNGFHLAEIEDALAAADALHMVLTRLGRLGLVDKEEIGVMREKVQEISETLDGKLVEP